MGKLRLFEADVPHCYTCGAVAYWCECDEFVPDRSLWLGSSADLVLHQILLLHVKSTGAGGMTDGYCSECQLVWPCETYHLAKGWGHSDECRENGWCDHVGAPLS